jgi:hypothetical protein
MKTLEEIKKILRENKAMEAMENSQRTGGKT